MFNVYDGPGPSKVITNGEEAVLLEYRKANAPPTPQTMTVPVAEEGTLEGARSQTE
jgi:hypothetical protein